ncbi:MAG: macro domain-containing protein [Lachnospiraceae bacterium]|nr:macro domain-containing protein [Lachnospiraceae bacterium]
MPINIIRNDITKVKCDAIVNAANPKLIAGGGGVDEAIHKAAGPGLDEECRRLGGLKSGQAKITGGYDLPCRYVIHTVGPHWLGGPNQKRRTLESCYRESLNLAYENHCETVAFPLIASGSLGFPKDEALQIAIAEISKFLLTHEMLVYIVVYDQESFHVSKRLIEDITEYIDAYYVEAHYSDEGTQLSTRLFEEGQRRGREWEPYPEKTQFSARPGTAYSIGDFAESEAFAPDEDASMLLAAEEDMSEMYTPDDRAAKALTPGKGAPRAVVSDDEVLKSAAPAGSASIKRAPKDKAVVAGTLAGKNLKKSQVSDQTIDLSDLLKNLDESFSQMLLRKIDEKGMTDAQCYKKANVDRKLFSKIRSNVNYKPSKTTAIAFAIALELSLDETKDLLAKAGFALSHSSRFDIVIEYFISKGIYDIYTINIVLLDLDLSLLGI